ncbi:MAG: VWA domain-containing protein [Deltaproteobacteria bacterium]|nr:VWA domain-containing protein [Deltaproteobacteria bacterium]
MNKILFKFILVLAAFGIFCSGSAGAQDRPNSMIAAPEIMPPRPNAGQYKVEAVELVVTINGQKAEVLLRQTVFNPGSQPIELDFMVPLPLEGAVSGLNLLAGGKELVGEVYSRDEAFRIYQDIVRTLRDPALLEYADRGLFRARVFPVEPNKSTTLELSMSYLLPKDNGRVDFVFPLAGPLTAGQAVPRQEVAITVKGKGLSGFYSPIPGFEIDQTPDGARAELKVASEKVTPSVRLHFLEESGPMGGLIISHKPDPKEDGFFLFLADPVSPVDPEKGKIPKTVIFVLDRSGSMEGEKFRQAQAALKFVLERLEPEDSFNLVDFQSSVDIFKPELVVMNASNRKEATSYVDRLRAGGGTNIGAAMTKALGQVPSGRPTYVVLLTDGEPTDGITSESQLTNHIETENSQRSANIFCFGVGYNVNARLLDQIAGAASGFATFVAPEESIEDKVGSFFSKLTSPVMIKPELTVNLEVNRQIPAKLPDIFQGSQTLAVGRYPKGGAAVFTLKSREGDHDLVFNYRTVLANTPTEGGDFVARLWAQRRVGQLIEEIDQAKAKGATSAANEILDELVNLAKQYGILTPYTSFLALEDQSFSQESEIVERTRANLRGLDSVVGDSANKQRELKSDYLQAPMAIAPGANPIMESEAFAVDHKLAASPMAQLSPPRNLADKTFFIKDGQLVDGSINEIDPKNLQTIVRFSDEYFKLAEKIGQGNMVWLSQAEPTIFNFGGVNYLIADAK